MRLIFITAALLFLAGCVAPAQRAANEARFQETIPKCYDAKHCERMFAAARGWIIKHCAMKIQNITDTYIETYGSVDAGLACRMTKDPLPDVDGYSFNIAVGCGSLFCYPDPTAAAQSFNDSVGATQPLPASDAK